MIKLNRTSKKLMLLQRNELLSKKQYILRKKFGRFIFTNFFINYFHIKDLEKSVEKLFKKEFEIIKQYLPKGAKNIVDIGCGLGVLDIFLNKFYNNQANFFLLDKNRVDKKIKYGFNSNYESYNNLNETKKLLLSNDVSLNSLKIFDVEKKIKINKKIDLIISLKSMGYHYPLEQYMSLFKTCCHKNTIFIFDVYKKNYEINELKKYFDFVNIIHEEKNIHSLQRLYCKKFRG